MTHAAIRIAQVDFNLFNIVNTDNEVLFVGTADLVDAMFDAMLTDAERDALALEHAVETDLRNEAYIY